MATLHKFNTKSTLQEHIANIRRESGRIGFIPTMGALHQGHLELVKAAKNKGLYTVVSIFVNPSQFNNQEDLRNYPRTLAADLELLLSIGTDAVFTPTTEDIYPTGETLPTYEPGIAASFLEGPLRPGHFKGVTDVVQLLFAAVTPDEVFFGQKDLQQCLVIKEMIESLKLPYTFNMVPTYREKDGLAYSSRNMRLSAAEREIAPAIYKSLRNLDAQRYQEQIPIEIAVLNNLGIRTEYLEVRDANNLALPAPGQEKNLVALFAGWLGNTRLIDNRLL